MISNDGYFNSPDLKSFMFDVTRKFLPGSRILVNYDRFRQNLASFFYLGEGLRYRCVAYTDVINIL